MAVNGILLGTLVAGLLGLENPTLLALAGACAFLGAGYRPPLATAGPLAEISWQRDADRSGNRGTGIAMNCAWDRSPPHPPKTDARSV